MAKFLLSVNQMELKNEFKFTKKNHTSIPTLTINKVYNYAHGRPTVHRKINVGDIVYLKELGAGGVVFARMKVISSKTLPKKSKNKYLLELKALENVEIPTQKIWADHKITAGADYKTDFK